MVLFLRFAFCQKVPNCKKPMTDTFVAATGYYMVQVATVEVLPQDNDFTVYRATLLGQMRGWQLQEIGGLPVTNGR